VALQSHPLGVEAAIVGDVRTEPGGFALLETGLGDSRVVDMLVGDLLPRIC
jgi:hydrogenase expression/formation protein HypE